MNYPVYLQYDVLMSLNIRQHIGELCDLVSANIVYTPIEDKEKEEEDENNDEKIGFIWWFVYNQALARVYGINMNQVPYLNFQKNSNVLRELDYSCISQETIDEIGAASNPNVMVIYQFGIAAAWRNKGIGEQVIKGLIEQMAGKCGYILILHSRPDQCGENSIRDSFYNAQGVDLSGLEQDPEKAQWKLNAFWQRCGFRQFKDHDNVFICNVEQAVKENLKVMQPAI